MAYSDPGYDDDIPITNRPELTWPNGSRIAFWFGCAAAGCFKAGVFLATGSEIVAGYLDDGRARSGIASDDDSG